MSDLSLWHFTCRHSATGIRLEGMVRPWPQPLLAGTRLSWWTDLGVEHRFELGLTSQSIGCDRMEARFQAVDPAALTWWPKAARSLEVPQRVRDELEDGRLPAHWWISLEPVEVFETGRSLQPERTQP